MCTLGTITGNWLFKTRDLWRESGRVEEVVTGNGRLRYLGVRGQASPLERGLNSGINEAGVAVAITFADTVSLDAALDCRTPRGVLVEEILATCHDLDGALRRFGEFVRRPLVGGNIIIATLKGTAVIEQLYPRNSIELVTEPAVVRTNHFLNLNIPETLVGNATGSLQRHARMSQLLGDGEGIGLNRLKAVLADHDGAHSVCSHDGELHTVSGVIYDLAARVLHYAAGHPCLAPWQEHCL